MGKDCIFCKIAAGDIPATKLHEDEEMVAFRDVAPKAPTHIIIIPRAHIPTINDLKPEHAPLIGRMLLLAKQLAARAGVAEKGYRMVFNCNAAAGQSVWHIHLHLLGGRDLGWPPG
ncbi:MAG: histidine triad nucleotide-binding protein [Candidatus Sumerlaeota bacterium]|nr:histidine triad nucleotide-binding protein [Candidatus Sumerlaeota bacterium]